MNRLIKSYNPSELSLDELRAYQAGQLSGPARNRVERLMLDNPFYADALDGLEALHQVGSSLQGQTRELHEALQERVHESATTRRLMPLWVTSLVASVLLVISVAIYLIFRPTPPQPVDQAVTQHVEPGTVLLNPADLGPSADVASLGASKATTSGLSVLGTSVRPASVGTLPTSSAAGHKAGPLLRKKKQVWQRWPKVKEPTGTGLCGVEVLSVDEDIMTPPADPEVAKRQRVNTERAFLR